MTGKLLERIIVNHKIFGGKPITRRRRLAVEHILGMLAAGYTVGAILEGYPLLEIEGSQACLAYAHRNVGHEKSIDQRDTTPGPTGISAAGPGGFYLI